MSFKEWLEEAQACIRTRHLSVSEQAFFLFDHLEGEAREEIKYRSREEREDPDKIISALEELYGCSDSYVALQEAFFSRKQQEGETLQEFSLVLMGLMEKVRLNSPDAVANADVLLRDQFVEQVLDCALRRDLKRWVRGHPRATMLDVRGEAIRWEREGLPSTLRERSISVPSAFGIQYGVHGAPQKPDPPPRSELGEIRELLKYQQEQLTQLTQSLARLQSTHQRGHSPRNRTVICRHCEKPGHFARECEGVRVSRSQPLPHPSSQSHSAAEN